MLDLLSVPVSAVLWCTHGIALHLLGLHGGPGWSVAVVLLVLTVRTALLLPAVRQARHALRMAALAPHLDRLRTDHAGDPARLVAEMRALHRQHGVSPVVVQLPVLLGLSHLLYALGRTPAGRGHFVFDAVGVQSFVTAHVGGLRLTTALVHLGAPLAGVPVASLLMVAGLVLVCAVCGHLSGRIALRRATPAAGVAGRVGAVLTMWAAPVSALVVGPFLPLAVLLYWSTSAVATLGQQLAIRRLVPMPG